MPILTRKKQNVSTVNVYNKKKQEEEMETGGILPDPDSSSIVVSHGEKGQTAIHL